MRDIIIEGTRARMGWHGIAAWCGGSGDRAGDKLHGLTTAFPSSSTSVLFIMCVVRLLHQGSRITYSPVSVGKNGGHNHVYCM